MHRFSNHTQIFRATTGIYPTAATLFLLPVILVASATTVLSQQRSAPDTLRQASVPITVEAQRPYSAASDGQFRAADFALRPRNSAQDILRIVPGLMIAQHAGGGKAEQIFIRGFDCDHGTDINIRVDDAPVNMVSHGHGQGYADLHFIIPETIERVDVVKGPYFAKHGDFTTAGAVNFRTSDTLKENLVKLEGGMFNTFRTVALLRAPATIPGVNAYFGGEVFGSDGYFEAPQDYRRLNLFAKVHAGIVNKGALSASISTFSSGWKASGQVPQRAVDAGEITRFGSIDSLEGGATSRTTTVLRYVSGGPSPLMITGSYTDYSFRLYSNFTFFLTDSANGDMIEQTDRRSILALKAEKDIGYAVGDIQMHTRFGTDLRSDNIDVALYHDSARTRVQTTANGRINQRQLGLYAEQEIILPWAQFLFGVRADYIHFDVENFLKQGASPEGIAQQLLISPKANMSIPFADNLALFLNSGFGFHSNDARVVVAQPDQPTLPRAFGAEIGLRAGRSTDIFSGSVAAWMLDLESEFVYIGDAGETEPSGSTRRVGIDVEARFNPIEWLALGVDATFSRGRSLEDPEGENYIPLAPSLTLSANAVVRYDRFSAAARLRMVDDRPANEINSVVAKGYSIVDLSLSYKIIDEVELFANVENLLDAEWNEAQFDTESRLRNEEEPVSELHFTPGTPIAVRGGVGIRF